MRTITRDEWNQKKRNGYTLVRKDGTRCIVTMGERGTALVPVTVA